MLGRRNAYQKEQVAFGDICGKEAPSFNVITMSLMMRYERLQ